MYGMPLGMSSVLHGRRQWRVITTGAVLALPVVAAPAVVPGLGGTAWAQAAPSGRITGTVRSAGGSPLAGVTVRSGGADSVAITNATGRYSIGVAPQGTLSFSLIGYRRLQVPVGGRSTVDVTMERLALLEEVVVTSGYSGEGQRRAEVTGAVATVNVEATQRQTGASVLQRLDATVSGVTVTGSGSPGSRSTVRIRGISSFQNNDPLYVVDGTPVQDTYINFLNPNDIASIQVLKDASASSIYGSRASNGVIVIETTKRGTQGPPRTRLRARTGMQTPFNGYDKFLLTNSLDYFRVVRQSYLNAGFTDAEFQRQVYGRDLYGDPNNPTVPQYTYCGTAGCSASVDPAAYSYPNNLIMPGSAGTNWWREVFSSAPVSDVNLDVSGGGTGSTYALSFNYFDQSGTAAFNRLRRGSVRVNTSFTRGRFTVGENVALTGQRSFGGLANDSTGEGGFLGKNILSQPVVPVRDVGGNFASGKAQGLGNNTNPLKAATEARNNASQDNRLFGNVFANYDFTPRLAFRTTLGGNIGAVSYNGFTPATPENSEPNFGNQINEFNDRFTDYTWSNVLRYNLQGGRHNVSLLAGQELNRFQNRRISGSINNIVALGIDTRYIQDALGDAGTKNVLSTGGSSALLSYFGKADYTFNDRYTASFTLRRDGSSRLGPANQWGTFPAVGLAWQAGKERFLQNNRVISDLQLRVGYGVTGNQQIPPGRIFSQFGGDRANTFYDINGTGNKVVSGFRLVSLGNENLKWEQNRSVNLGVDVALFRNNLNVIVDAYNRVTDNLLYNPTIPATAGQADAPIVNVGKMRNRGFDFSVGHRGQAWSLTFNGSHYRNRILRIDGNTEQFFGPVTIRGQNPVINRVGEPIGAFFGYQTDGYFQSQAEVDALNAAARALPGAPADARYQAGAAPGRIKFRDTNGDGQVTLADRTIIGSPHPSFTGGLDLELRRGRFDLGATTFGSFGNKIFDVQKQYYVFSDFSTNVRKDRLENSWRPDNPNAKYPQLNVNDTFSRQYSSFYVENGSYVRLRSLQLGYTLPATGRVLPGSRLYVQGENLFTITGYDGLDPSLPTQAVDDRGRDLRDQFRGVDQGVYPTSRTFSVGFTTSF